MYRGGGITDVDDVVLLGLRAHRLVGWHVEIYADAAALKPFLPQLKALPQLVIDHLGMTTEGLPTLLELVDSGAKVKATGFGRVQLDVALALKAIAERDETALMYGSDLPSTRAKRPFDLKDVDLIESVLGERLAKRALFDNAYELYKVKEKPKAK
jgi:predicted TIM-barrel fold metal-dependent hydrolase